MSMNAHFTNRFEEVMEAHSVSVVQENKMCMAMIVELVKFFEKLEKGDVPSKSELNNIQLRVQAFLAFRLQMEQDMNRLVGEFVKMSEGMEMVKGN